MGIRCVLKKWTVNINSAASKASSEWKMLAILKTQPGYTYDAISGAQRVMPEPPMINIPQKTARKSNFSQYVQRSNFGYSPLLKNHITIALNCRQSCLFGIKESGPKSLSSHPFLSFLQKPFGNKKRILLHIATRKAR